jgi:hypothetical protein
MPVSRHRFSVVALVTVLSITSIAPPVFADAYDAAMARAVAAKAKAVDSNDPAAWNDALRLFEEADAIRTTKDSKYELAGAAARLKEDDIAVEAYEAAIKLGLSGKAKDKAQTFIAAHLTTMGRLDVHGPAGTELTVGARKRGVLPRAPLVVFAGSVKLRATHAGTTVEETVAVKDGATVVVDVAPKLEAAAAPPPAPPTDVAPTPPESSETVPLSDTGAGARALGWTLVVSGGVLVVSAGIGLVISSTGLSSRRDSLRDKCITYHTTGDRDQCALARPGTEADARSDNDAIKSWKAVRTASLVTGGVGFMIVGVGVVRLLLAPKPPRASAWEPTFNIGANGATVGIAGAF